MTSKTHDIIIRQMEKRDAERILALINIEGWDYHISEIERMLRISPGTSIVACEGDSIIGGITAVTIKKRCVLGHVVIEDKYRGKGIGSLLIDSLFASELAHGVTIFDVFSIKSAIPFYRRHGFHSLETLDTYSKVITEKDRKPCNDPRVRALSTSDLEQMRALDAKISGFDRKKILESLMIDFPGKSFGMFESGTLVGFVQARFTSVMCDIGPWIMQDPNIDDANRLFDALSPQLPVGIKAIAGVSESNEVVRKILNSRGFKIELNNYRLVRSASKISPFTQGTLSISGFELG